MENNNLSVQKVSVKKGSDYFRRLGKDWKKNRSLYLLVLPVVLFYIIFCYVPMYGIVIAFQNYDPAWGFTGSPWVGLQNFKDFFSSIYFFRILKNTLNISFTGLLFGFPAPIILALMINEISSKRFIKTVQTITYLPHFISLVVLCGMIIDFTNKDGIITQFLTMFGVENKSMLINADYFVPIYVISDIWQGIGWGSIIYISALLGVDQQLYEACEIDGGGRIIQTIHITLPCILPTIIIMLILRMGNILNVGYEKIILLYNSSIYKTADVISSFVYRKGLQEFNWSYGTAVSVFNSLINIVFLASANVISRKVTETSLW